MEHVTEAEQLKATIHNKDVVLNAYRATHEQMREAYNQVAVIANEMSFAEDEYVRRCAQRLWQALKVME